MSRIPSRFNPKIISPRLFDIIDMLPEEIREMLYWCGCIWRHGGNPKSPHVVLRSGLCSDGFVECMRALRFPYVCEILAIQLAKKLNDEGIKRLDFVVGAPIGGMTFANEVAKAFSAEFVFMEKDPRDRTGRKMLWRGDTLPRGAIGLRVDDVLTSGGSVREMKTVLDRDNREPIDLIPVVGVIVHRPPILPVSYDGFEVVSLLEIPGIKTFKPAECPLCRAGSSRLSPKRNWQQLITGTKKKRGVRR